MLEIAGFGSSLYLNLINLLAAGIGLVAVRSIARSRKLPDDAIKYVILGCLFSFILVKDAAMPLTDVPFFGVTLAAVALAESAACLTGRAAWSRWFIAILLAVCGISLRLAGIAGVLALLFEAWRAAMRSTKAIRNAATAVFVANVAGLIGGFIIWSLQPGTAKGTLAVRILQVYGTKPLWSILGDHFRDAGQLLLNLPISKIPADFRGISWLAGFVLLTAVTIAIFRTRAVWAPSRTFLLLYSLMLFASAYTPGGGSEPRYWLPALPLFAIELLLAGNQENLSSSPLVRLTLQSYVVYFVSLGIIAIGYSCFLTISSRAFLDAPITSNFKSQYEAWLLHRPMDDGPDPRVLPVLRTFGGNR
ncbi:MAG TPA: hypothetical protein VG273_20750 [Bryobacteraceae bacterium]|nr:hypothetical protein [Bryobacteraceae bacterium]